MYDTLKSLFGRKKPSVSKFEIILSELPPVRRLYYRQLAYKVALCEWDYLTVDYKTFLTNFITRDWQRSVDYLLEHTALGELRFDLQEPDIIQRFIGLTEGRAFGHEASFVHLAFSLRLSFAYDYDIEYFGDKLRSIILTATDLNMLKDKTPVTNEPGYIGPRVK
ncbi:hypothetical protein [Parabacteroides leei]|uniref:hypothetical protein n=1 Tax=Parabacteroides leei TaxID=2939491 RepID=UPI003241D81D